MTNDNHTNTFSFLDFFAGSGLVEEGVKPYFKAVWANDVSTDKASVFKANQGGKVFHLGSIAEVSGADLPQATLSWGSFPCQDLSLAGDMKGIEAARSGLVWHWLRVMDEMKQRPPIVVAENVTGLVSAENGIYYRALHKELVGRGYKVGVLELDASLWLPQSRKRVFVIGVRREMDIEGMQDLKPNWAHSGAIRQAMRGLQHSVLWKLPQPPAHRTDLSDIIEFDAPCFEGELAQKTLGLIPEAHWVKLRKAVGSGLRVATAYKRIRNGRQVLEVRTDGISGCLRTANGGSSRQFVVLYQDGAYRVRLMTVRETARLMGATERYILPKSYNAGYSAMGDAVAVPVTRFLTKHLLLPLARRTHMDELESLLQEYQAKDQIVGKGPLSVMLVITRKAKETGLPLDPGALVTGKRGQVKGLSMSAVQNILKDYGESRVLAKEGGRTSRGSLEHMRTYVDFLNMLQSQGKADLSKIERWWVDRAKDYFASKPFKLHIDPAKSMRSIIKDLLEQATEREKESPGTNYRGAVMQHLVGAKLELALPGCKIIHHGFSVADEPTGRSADYIIDDVAIHVTTMPTPDLIRKCKGNLTSGIKPIIVTIHAGILTADELGKAENIDGRVDIFEIEQFITLNIYEISRFKPSERFPTVIDIVKRYNQIIDTCETDLSLKIEHE